jgi:hypothetical protein
MAITLNIIESYDYVRYVQKTGDSYLSSPISPLSPSLWYVNYVWIHSISSPKYTDKKENKIFLIVKVNPKGSGCKSYMTNGLLPHLRLNICAFPHI